MTLCTQGMMDLCLMSVYVDKAVTDPSPFPETAVLWAMNHVEKAMEEVRRKVAEMGGYLEEPWVPPVTDDGRRLGAWDRFLDQMEHTGGEESRSLAEVLLMYDPYIHQERYRSSEKA